MIHLNENSFDSHEYSSIELSTDIHEEKDNIENIPHISESVDYDEDDSLNKFSNDNGRNEYTVSPALNNKHINLSSHFDIEIKLRGFIKQVNENDLTFVVLLRDENNQHEYERELSFDDVEIEDINKIREGARIIYAYGKQYVMGTAYNASSIIFRAESTWNKYKIKSRQKKAAALSRLISYEDPI